MKKDISKEELIKKILEEEEVHGALVKKILLGNLYKFNKFEQFRFYFNIGWKQNTSESN